MDIRRFVRGTVPWTELETVAAEIRQRYDRDSIRLEFLEADNWLSTPVVVDDEWFVKIISPQNALVHAVFTGARNLGAFSSGSAGFFQYFESPYEMAKHELDATETLRSVGINVPDPVEAFEVGEFGVLVLEYLPEFESIDDAQPETVADRSPELFETLARMHAHNLAHGDLRGENVLIYDTEIYFIDVTNVREDGIEEAIAYDIASALAILSPIIGARRAVNDAVAQYHMRHVLEARDFLDIVRLRPDHDFDAAATKGEIEKRASQVQE